MGEDKGKKFNQGKTMHDLVPAFAQEQYAKVLTHGAEKYGPNNWRLGMQWSKIIAAIKRHLLAIESGEDYDNGPGGTGLLHAAHLMCEAGFLTEYYKIFPQGDNRQLWHLKNYRIGLDIDDVLANFCPAFCDKFDLPIPKYWNFDRSIGDKFAQLDEQFWTNLPVKTHPDQVPFEPVCYITSRSIKKAWTESWLDKNGFAAVPVYQVGIDGSKVEIAAQQKLDIFVDDRFSNFVELTNAGIFTYLFDAPHNTRYEVGHRRIKSLSDIVNRFV
jgi:hypothetical protein